MVGPESMGDAAFSQNPNDYGFVAMSSNVEQLADGKDVGQQHVLTLHHAPIDVINVLEPHRAGAPSSRQKTPAMMTAVLAFFPPGDVYGESLSRTAG